jgi:ribosomal protein S18 acetylase RimI-like enzyme
MNLKIRPMTAADYEQTLALWQEVEGVGLSSADSREQIERYLRRNPGQSLLAWREDLLIGAVLCGHDGRRGYIHHLAVRPGFRRQGVGRLLVSRCLAALAAEGIEKCHLFVFSQNEAAVTFWQAIGFTERAELSMMSTAIVAGKETTVNAEGQ